MSLVTIGVAAPAFSIAISDMEVITLDHFKGNTLVLYFYPKDATPGCTLEAQGFRDHYSDFIAHKAVIVGISQDSITSHERFCADHQLPFLLLSDTAGHVCSSFEVIKTKSRFGKTITGIERSTFLIDSTGILREEWRNVRVNGHVKTVLKAVKLL